MLNLSLSVGANVAVFLLAAVVIGLAGTKMVGLADRRNG